MEIDIFEESKEEETSEVEPTRLGAPLREVWKPDISGFADAIVGREFIVPVGKDVIIEYPELWRETAVMKVMHVFGEDLPTEEVEVEYEYAGVLRKKKLVCVVGTTVRHGHVRLLDQAKNHFAATNYLEAPGQGLIIKIWVPKLKGK